ncbi:MAG: D-sedoheptulose 7-phosphate isomerase [Lentimicrobium sp.]|jgi:D-sedoheptulose 7-phosphate isomerase|nr:D-sedoheptulose 7-phosphate isomerase [Lentimicrobium sp.]MDD4598572.1 D-sedoheptulose 7-phosphate isomerase [Lentimicrobiaceae bacterium]MDY0024764.1 D-sedoheptulose 7-phosphate isomerase [Lentimicrobium sp.]HAH58619.1 phosphoheptose isomerase [Bacteroidales bacterium]
MYTRIKEIIQSSIAVKALVLADENLLATTRKVIDAIVNCYRNGGKVLLCGNGGSAADAQHLAAELSGRFYYDRAPLNAEALHVNTSFLTAVGNDYSFDDVYARMIFAAGKPGDVLVALSTSGNSPNILKAATAAREIGLIVVGMTGKSGGNLNPLCDLLLNIPSGDTPRIQESHITLGHIICELVESELFPR